MKTLLLLLIASVAYGWEPSTSFLAYLKQVEGCRNAPYIDNGHLAIGIGHRIKSGEAFIYISDTQAVELLKSDLKAVGVRLQRNHTNLNEKQMEMLTDFSFNGCSESMFPKFYRAVEDNDFQGIAREYKRYCNGRALTGHNKAFEKRFLCQ